MRILALEHDLNTPTYANLEELQRDEARAVWQLQQADVIRGIWFTAAERNAVILLECADADAARLHLDTLPRVRHGYSNFKLYPLHSYDGFARLFAAGATAKVEEPPEY
ncbi:MAG: hypothetical protein KF897_12975 [Opitutaceae bacterium]|nr:hypothetical protein [Opitutaceae bacterium]